MREESETEQAQAGLVEGAGTGRLVLRAGEVLCSKGAKLDAVYQVRSGALAVIDDDVELATVTAPALIGDISAIAGGTATAEVRATEPSELAVIPLATFEAWLGDHPDEAAEITRTARIRADRTRAAAILADIVGPTSGVDPAVILDRLETVHLAAGRQLFAQGDASDAAYIVLTGRLHIHGTDDAGEVAVDTEVGRGALVGELGIIDDDARSATIRAVRGTTLGRLARTDFEELAGSHPALTLRIVRSILDRMRDTTRAVAKARNVTLAVTDPTAKSAEVAETILDEVSRFGPTQLVDEHIANSMLGRPGLARSPMGTIAHDRLSDQFHEIEANSDYLLFGVATAEDDPWLRRVVERSDRLVIVCSARPGADEQTAIDRLIAASEQATGIAVWIVRRYGDGARPYGAARWLDREQVDQVLQIRAREDGDLRRIARLVTGNGVGLVLSGGGGRGFAHLGVFTALEEVNVPIDAIAGTSIGAVMGAGLVIGLAHDERVEVVAQAFHNLLDYTMPIVAMLRSERITGNIDDTFGMWDIENGWLPFAAVSTSLTTASVKVHRTGSLATAIRASVSLPAVLPPVTHEGELLVDGGLLDNLPVDLIADDDRIGTVIAVDLEAPAPPSSRSDFRPNVSGLRALKDRIDPRAQNYPTIGSTLIRSLLVTANRRRDEVLASGAIDLTIVLDLDGVGLLDFERVAEIATLGYHSAKPQIQQWLDEGTQPWRDTGETQTEGHT